MDVGSDAHGMAVPKDRGAQPVQCFGACTADLYALAAWLQQCRIETVVMESTGVYWSALFAGLEERGFDVKLVDPHTGRHVPGRKTDVQDCQWLQELHTYGLLRGAFRPADKVCVLRSDLRQRHMLVTMASRAVQHMQKALEQMHLKLTEVVSDITGKTGMTILRGSRTEELRVMVRALCHGGCMEALSRSCALPIRVPSLPALVGGLCPPPACRAPHEGVSGEEARSCSPTELINPAYAWRSSAVSQRCPVPCEPRFKGPDRPRRFFGLRARHTTRRRAPAHDTPGGGEAGGHRCAAPPAHLSTIEPVLLG